MPQTAPIKVKAGDDFNFGDISAASVQRLEKLPKLQAGVTHEENGPFAEFLKEYLQDVDDDDDDDNNNNGVDEEEKPSPKKQRVQ